MASSSLSAMLAQITTAGKAYEKNGTGSRESHIELSRALVAALEIPSEFIQRSFWAEPILSAHCRLAVDVKLFQHLRDAGDTGLSPDILSERIGVDILLLRRVMRHLAAMHLMTYHDGSFHATILSNGLADQNYQESISFCYDASRPSFNGFPKYFKKSGYRQPTSLTDGPFQDAHKTQLPFFDWLVATPPHLSHFDSLISAYRAGKANWYDPGFYPVSERLMKFLMGVSATSSLWMLVEVEATISSNSRPSIHLVLQVRGPIIASVVESTDQVRPYEAQAHDFFTPQPVKFARACSLHSIQHDWGDDDGIVLSDENPTLAATSIDMMMLAHFAVRERSEADWRAILERAGLKVCNIYTYPGVAGRLVEAELAG
ncbi:putative hydroxyindole O-methyltransferase [Acephala macrosclerotiorum]|nr:putative hydroxyindole O-methyltransferase [Acephala macrosclerotiorum]